MGAAGLIEIKRRIKSVESTRKITNAMGLVATSKLRKCRSELRANEEYAEASKKIMQSLAGMQGDSSNPYFTGNKGSKKLYIIITSDSGLCAGYNGNVVTYLEELVKDDVSNTCVITVGSKGIPYIKKTGYESVAEFVDIPDVPTGKEVKMVINKALSLYRENTVSEVHVVYTQFISPIKQIVKEELLLPITKPETSGGDQIVEPDFDTVLNDALEVYLKGTFRNIMLTSKCSEQAARMTAMDGATSNANDLISDLNLKFNRIRQSIITQEISEIVGGANAQK